LFVRIATRRAVKTVTRDLNRPRVEIRPGEILLEEFLRPAALSQVEAARRMGIPLNRLNEIVRGRRAITADTALRLAALFKISPEFWMNLQTSWDRHQARLAMKRAG
jgi:addiction module HigA family antidote